MENDGVGFQGKAVNRDRKTPRAAFFANRRGSVAIELALLAPILAFMLVGAVDFGSYIYAKMQLQNASRAGAQYATQAAENLDDTAAILVAIQAATELEGSTTITQEIFCGCVDGVEFAIDGSLGCTSDCAGGEFPALTIRITLSNTFTTLFPYPGFPDTLTLTGETILQLP